MSTPKALVYILYNANASVMGKVGYAYRKITAPANQSPCAACDFTHGGLSLTETPEWVETKKRIGAEVKQLHKDESNREIIDFVTSHNLKYPLILGRKEEGGSLELLLEAKEIQGCNKDHAQFLAALKTSASKKGILLDISE